MSDIRDYLVWRGNLRFAQSPLNEVDSLILTEITYMDYAAIGHSLPAVCPLHQAAADYFRSHPLHKNMLGLLLPDEILDVLQACAASVRFGTLLLSHYVADTCEKEEKQFAAITFDIDDKLRYISFRGTDDQLVGWKEDFNMSFRFPVPAQTAALRYLLQVAAEKPEAELILGGHSKGGNLAMYAAASCPQEIFRRIRCIYNHDGPGFPSEKIANGIYQRIAPKLVSLIPEDSVVGILMESQAAFRIVKSDALGIFQHNGLTWQVRGTSFETLEKASDALAYKKKTIRNWMHNMSLQQRKEMTENMFSLRHHTPEKTLLEIFRNPRQTIPAVLASYDKETREVLWDSLSLLLKEEGSNLKDWIRAENEKHQAQIKENLSEAWEKIIAGFPSEEEGSNLKDWIRAENEKHQAQIKENLSEAWEKITAGFPSEEEGSNLKDWIRAENEKHQAQIKENLSEAWEKITAKSDTRQRRNT